MFIDTARGIASIFLTSVLRNRDLTVLRHSFNTQAGVVPYTIPCGLSTGDPRRPDIPLPRLSEFSTGGVLCSGCRYGGSSTPIPNTITKCLLANDRKSYRTRQQPSYTPVSLVDPS